MKPALLVAVAGWFRVELLTAVGGPEFAAAAGLLEGRRATSHWCVRHHLADWGATPANERFVFDGKYATSAGISAGIDLALAIVARLASDQVAQSFQLIVEYDPAPPFDAGSPAKAPKEMVDQVRQAVEPRFGRRARLTSN